MSNPETRGSFVKDLKFEHFKTLAELEEENRKLLEKTREDLEIIKESLRELIDKIQAESPDFIVFLDKGARIFGIPFRKYLREQGIDKIPEVRFYNDEKLKKSYTYGEGDDIENIGQRDFSAVKDKKLFFIDETFSGGKGAICLQKALQASGLEDYQYFALSQNPEPTEDVKDWQYSISEKQYREDKKQLEENPKFTVYPNSLEHLFSKDASGLYIAEDETSYEISSRYQPLSEDEAQVEYEYDDWVHVRHDKKPPHKDMSWQEYDERVRKMNMETVRQIQKEIYKALQGK